MDPKTVSNSIAGFAIKFCNELPKGKNVVSSPLSAEYLLALVALGCTEPARSELLTALGIPDDDAIRSTFESVSTQLRTIKGVTLNVANRIYIKQGPYELEPRLLEDATKIFDAGMEKVPFNNDTVASINKWVENMTNDKIKNIVAPGSFDDNTRVVLMNAIYFKGIWKNPFNVRNTLPRPFHVDAKTTIEVPTMYGKENFNYKNNEELGAQLLELPYEGAAAKMVIILPKEIEGLNDIMQKLAAGYDLFSQLDNMRNQKVEVFLPTFKIETEINLNSLLPKLGIKSIFRLSNSGLSKILIPSEPLYVSKAVQKAFIEVNEQGTEAAASTHYRIQKLCMPPPVPCFACDRPFLYVITPGRLALFIGVYSSSCQYCSMPRRFACDRPFLYVITAGRLALFIGVYSEST